MNVYRGILGNDCILVLYNLFLSFRLFITSTKTNMYSTLTGSTMGKKGHDRISYMCAKRPPVCAVFAQFIRESSVIRPRFIRNSSVIVRKLYATVRALHWTFACLCAGVRNLSVIRTWSFRSSYAIHQWFFIA